jgi:hypothetical protein
VHFRAQHPIFASFVSPRALRTHPPTTYRQERSALKNVMVMLQHMISVVVMLQNTDLLYDGYTCAHRLCCNLVVLMIVYASVLVSIRDSIYAYSWNSAVPSCIHSPLKERSARRAHRSGRPRRHHRRRSHYHRLLSQLRRRCPPQVHRHG